MKVFFRAFWPSTSTTEPSTPKARLFFTATAYLGHLVREISILEVAESSEGYEVVFRDDDVLLRSYIDDRLF